MENDNLTLAVAQCAQMLEEKVVQFNPKLTQNNCIFYLKSPLFQNSQKSCRNLGYTWKKIFN